MNDIVCTLNHILFASELKQPDQEANFSKPDAHRHATNKFIKNSEFFCALLGERNIHIIWQKPSSRGCMQTNHVKPVYEFVFKTTTAVVGANESCHFVQFLHCFTELEQRLVWECIWTKE